jgi:hypothetical protein
MPTERKILVYKFDELSDKAKERARDKWREGQCDDSSWFEFTFDDAVTCASILGIEIDHHAVKLMNGSTTNKPTIYFSGFCSQGDGACFEGSYAYAKGCSKKIREHAPKDAELHRIANELTSIQRKHFYRLEATVKHSGHYSHSRSTSIDVYDREDQYGRDIGTSGDDISECLRDFMDWIYHQLEAEYEYQMSDECIDESIKCNEVEFDEDGRIA